MQCCTWYNDMQNAKSTCVSSFKEYLHIRPVTELLDKEELEITREHLLQARLNEAAQQSKAEQKADDAEVTDSKAVTVDGGHDPTQSVAEPISDAADGNGAASLDIEPAEGDAKLDVELNATAADPHGALLKSEPQVSQAEKG